MNEFIKIYDEQRNNRQDCADSYAFASGRLAFSDDATIDDLKDLYAHFVNDLSETFNREMRLFDEKLKREP